MAQAESQGKRLSHILFRLEILQEVQRGRRTQGWFDGKTDNEPRRAEEVRYLLTNEFIQEAASPALYTLTGKGETFLTDRIPSWERIWSQFDQLVDPLFAE